MKHFIKKLVLVTFIICMFIPFASLAEKGVMYLTSPDNFQVMSLSPNGKWACGILGDGYSINQGLLWNLETSEITYLSTTDESTAYAVTDEGVVCGGYTDYTLHPAGLGVYVAGIYKDGEWHRLDNLGFEDEGVLMYDSEAYAISADGRTIVGSVQIESSDSKLAPARWVDGKLDAILPYEKAGVCYAITRDGSKAAGWAYQPDDDGTMNRSIAVWEGDGIQYLSPKPTTFEAGRFFSADGSKLVCESFGHKFIYDLTTQEKTELPWVHPNCWSQSVYYVNNDGIVLGGEEFLDDATGAIGFYGYVYDAKADKAYKFDQWMKDTYGVEIDSTYFKTQYAVAMSDDAKTFAILSYRVPTDAWVSKIIKLDQEVPNFMEIGDKFTVDGIHYEVLNESGQVAVIYYGDNNIPDEYKYAGEVVIPESVTYEGVTYSVTSIGDGAFSLCDGLTSITIPNSVTLIDNTAFSHCDGLTSINIGEGNRVYDSRENCNAIIKTATNTLVAGCKKTIIPNSVTSIGDKAFYECWELTTITIPSSVTSIGYYAFFQCHGLTEITIPESVTSISDGAYSGCTGLTSIKVEEGNTVYDSREGCNAIIETATNTLVAGCKKTIIPNSVTSIGDYAFGACDGLTSVTIPESVTSIGDWAFSSCSGLTSVTIPESVTSIGYCAFASCSGLTSITIPESVTSIGDYAFDNCSGLTSITIPSSVTALGMDVFRGCTGLTSIRIEAVNPPTIESSTFEDVDKTIPVYVPAESLEAYKQAEYWSEFTNIVAYAELEAGDKFTVDGIHYEVLNESGQVAVTYYGEDAWNVPEEYKYAGSVMIPETVSYQGATYSVTSIGDDAFVYCSGLTSVTIPNSVTSIGDDAFVNCSGLTSVTIPNSVISIGNGAFHNCDGLTLLTIPQSVTSIGEFAFGWCFSLTSITIPNSVISIGNGAFYYCWALTSIVVEEGNTVYDSRESCNAIIETATNTLVVGCKNTVISNSVTSIGAHAFCGCTGLTSVTIPNSVTSIGEAAFNGCSVLTSITIPEGVTLIGNRAFGGCPDLTEIAIPSSVTSIGNYAFEACIGLTSIKVEDANTVYDSRENCNAIIETATNTLVAGCKNTIIPNSVTSIYNDAFSWRVTSITIPNSITSIGDNAFSYCSGLTEITIPNSVTSIGYDAFSYCDGLTSIRIEAVNPPAIEENTFNSVDKSIPVYVPAESVEAYQSAEYWSEFTNIVAYTELEHRDKFTVDGIHYEVLNESGQVAVTYYGEDINNIPDEYKYAGTVVIPESVTYEGVTYSVTSIGNEAFSSCTGLTSVTIPNSVTSIGDYAFSDCSGLTAITIPNSVTSIGNHAFSSCFGLTEITIPESVTSIGDGAYSGCSGLTSIKVEEGNTVYDSREGCNAIIETATNTLVAGCKKTIIPNSVTSIGDYAFGACAGLTSITIPESVTSIGDYAFSSCSGLMSVTIPESVTSIGDGAFYYCYGLTSIRIEAVNPSAIESNTTFFDVDKSIPVYVPTQECVEAYRNAEYWSEFTNILSYTETLTYDVVVPAGTWECYIIGEFNQMSEFVLMTKINDTHYTITIEGVERSMHYQYACGNGREYVEAGDVRTYNENDVVEGWTNMPAVEAGEPEANRLQSGGVTVSRLYDVLSTARVPMVVELINEAAISALQCDIYLPEGLSVATVENGLDVAMGNRGSHDHTIDARTLDNGAIRVLVMSGTAAPLTGNAGALFTIGVIPNENYTEDAQIVICNIVMTDTDIVEYNPKQIFADCHIKESVLGDANSDGRVNVTDIVLLAKYILGGYNGNIDVLAADINQDSRINVSDIVALANLILSGKGAAGAPARQEGVQGTLSMDHVLLNTNAPTIAPMMLDNTVAYTAFQMDVIVPEGLCIEDVVCGERLTAAHNLMWKEQADGSVRIIAFATDNTPIKESQGELFHLVLSAEDGFADGEIYVSDAIFVTRGMLTHQVNDIVAGVSAPTGIEAMYSNNRVYAAHSTIVIETTCEQPAYITTIDGVSQSIDLQPGRNVLQVSQQGVYIVTVGNENKKVVVK